MDNRIDNQIDDLVGALTDPIIVWPGPWQDTLPEWIKPAITMERLIQNIKVLKGETPTATDLEVLAYMYPRTLEAPMGHDWTQIYLYIAAKVMPQVPDDTKVESLTQGQLRDLQELKDWIYQHRLKVRQERRRAAKREAKAEAAARAPVQLGLNV